MKPGAGKPEAKPGAPASPAAPASRSESGSDFRREMLAQLPGLRAFAVSLCGRSDVADDLVQDAVLGAWAGRDGFVPGSNMRAWLFRILRNGFYSRLRKTSREVPDSGERLAAQLAVAPPQHASLAMHEMRRALDALPGDQREAIILVGASGFSYEEAAEICGCATGTLKSRVHRARARLREVMALTEDEGAETFGSAL
ncbi:sigma-70 family RNA polymerase sigma factor [Stappia sp. TSB10P1A]|uniref:sigma-70 family RNA polymerase sigma factor n=1 Tax=Stappia sp. TSB10P1A TaxID=2003585 RepID=UPI0016439C5C